jgi:chemotaxis protein MotD
MPVAAAPGTGLIQAVAQVPPAQMSDRPGSESVPRNGRLPSGLPAGSRETLAAVADILVVGRETHLAPVATPRAAPIALGGDAVKPALASGDAPSADPISDLLATHRAAGPSGDASALAPQLPPTPVRQIADRIAAHIAGAEPGRADPPAPVPTPTAATVHPLKVLTIQLHPAELGAVTVRIALRSDALELQIDAGRRETARLLDADRDTLSGLLRSAGYGVDALTVRAVEPSNAGAAAGWSPSTAQPQSGSAQPDARPGGRAPAEQDSGLHQATGGGNDEQGVSRDRDRDGLYV